MRLVRSSDLFPFLIEKLLAHAPEDVIHLPFARARTARHRACSVQLRSRGDGAISLRSCLGAGAAGRKVKSLDHLPRWQVVLGWTIEHQVALVRSLDARLPRADGPNKHHIRVHVPARRSLSVL
jgi:hypothetical protein